MNKINPILATRELESCDKKITVEAFVSSDTYPLTENQRGIWMAQIYSPGSSHFNIGFRARIKGSFSVRLLVNAIQAVVAGNDALRLVIDGGSGNVPLQRLLNVVDAAVEEIDISGIRHDEASQAELVHEIVNRPFVFDGSLLFRNVVIRLGGGRFPVGLLFPSHHR